MPNLHPGTLGLVLSFAVMGAIPFFITYFVKRRIRQLDVKDYIRHEYFRVNNILIIIMSLIFLSIAGLSFYASVAFGENYIISIIGLFFLTVGFFTVFYLLKTHVIVSDDKLELNYWRKNEVIKFKSIQAVTIVSTYPLGYIKVYLASGQPSIIPIMFKNSAELYSILKHKSLSPL